MTEKVVRSQTAEIDRSFGRGDRIDVGDLRRVYERAEGSDCMSGKGGQPSDSRDYDCVYSKIFCAVGLVEV